MRITWPVILLLTVLSLRVQGEPEPGSTKFQNQKSPLVSPFISVDGGVLPEGSRFAGVQVASYLLAENETTWSEWQAVRSYAEEHGYDFKKSPDDFLPDHPAQGMSWFDAIKWCNAKSEMEGLDPFYMLEGDIYRKGHSIPSINPKANGYRLPSGAEWEWAARGGPKSKHFTYSGGNDLNKVAWNWNNSAGAKQDMSDGRGTWPVARKEANELGFHDMSGNVAEWSGDEANGPFRGIRGGAWYGASSDCAVAHVNYSSAETGASYIGFRTARGGKIQSTSQVTFATGELLPAGKTGTPYSANLEASGGTAPLGLYVKKPSSLPAGLTLSNGKISGVPTSSGSFTFTVAAEDSSPSLRVTAEKNFTIEIASYGLEITSEPATISSKVGEPLALALNATGGQPPFKWSTPDGLPRGLGLDASTGRLSGTPTRPENASLNIRVTDSKGFTATRSIPFAITTDPLELSATPAPSPMAGIEFLWQLEAKGGIAPYKFTVAPDSSLPAGVYLSTYNPPGRILGKSKSPGTHSVKIVATDSLGQSIEREYTLQILPYDLTVSTPKDPVVGKYGEPLELELKSTGGVPPHKWSVTGGLPDGLKLDNNSGKIDGSPLVAGQFEVAVKVTDSNFKSATGNLSFQIAVDPLAIKISSLPPAKAGTSYTVDIPTAGGVPPVNLSLKAGNELPPGLTLSQGKITGTPTAAGSFAFTIIASDSNVRSKSKTEQSFTLEIASYGMEIGAEPSILSGKVKEPLSTAFTVTGGEPPYRWTASGNLPRGLSINPATGLLSGIPSSLANSVVTIRVTDAKGFPVTRSIPLSITADPLTISTEPPPSAMAGADFLWQIPVKGGLPPYKVESAESAKLPPGLYLSEYAPHGRILGEPSIIGNYTFKVIAKDSLSQETTQDITIHVVPYDLTMADIVPLRSKYNEPFKFSPMASGGVPPLLWSIQGSMPKGLSINSSSGTIEGVPLEIGQFDFSVKVTDAKRKFVTKNASLQITAEPLAITTKTLPPAKAGVPVDFDIQTTGGVLPLNLKLKTGDSLPAGLKLSKGKITGTPLAAGSFHFTVLAEDSNPTNPSQSEQAYNLEVESYGMEIATEPAFISGKFREPLSLTFSATGGKPPYKWTASGDVPSGLSINASTGVLSGTPSEQKIGVVMIRVIDATGFPSTRSIPVSITTDPLEIVNEPAPQTHVGADFKWSFQTKGGVSPRPIKLAPESTLPPGLYMSFNATSAIIKGKPRVEGTFPFSLIVEDAGAAPVKKELVVVVMSSKPEIRESPLPVEITTASLPPAQIGSPYNVGIEASGGVPPLKIEVKPGSQLPAGLLLIKNRLSGNPSEAGHFTFTLSATDIQGSNADAVLTLTVEEKPMQIAGPKNAKAEEFKPFTAELRVKGGKPPYTWMSRSQLPAGLTLNATSGLLSGTPEKGTAGKQSAAVQVTDSDGKTSAGLFTFTISAGEPLTITDKPLPAAAVNAPYKAVPATKGGSPKNPVWSIEAGKLPSGLSLDATTGAIQGTPTEIGVQEFTLKATDSFGNSCTRNFTIATSVDFNPGMVFVLGGKMPASSPMGEQKIADFYLSRYELTWGEWKQTRADAAAKGYDIADAGKSSADNHPVHDISWYDAVKWCNLKSEIENLTPVYTVGGKTYKSGTQIPEANLQANGYRLPTELEWEWAARGGVSSRGSSYSGGNEIDSVAWHAGNTPSGETHTVALKASNELGLNDMSGNVQEWCWDAYKNYRRVRGGSFKDDAFACTVTASDFTIPDRALPNTGLRPARTFSK